MTIVAMAEMASNTTYPHMVLNDGGLIRLAANLIYTTPARCHFHITRIGEAVRQMPV